MKKLLFGIVLGSMLVLAACGNDEKDKEASEGKSIEVNKGLVDVELTLPAEMFEGQTPEEIEANAKEQGVKEVKVNPDGSVYYKMSKSDHDKMMKEMGDSIKEGLESIANSEDTPSIKEIKYNKDFTKFDIKVDREAYENSMDGFVMFSLALSSMFYNALDGKDTDSLKITINMIDAATNEIFDTTVYPDDLQEESETE